MKRLAVKFGVLCALSLCALSPATLAFSQESATKAPQAERDSDRPSQEDDRPQASRPRNTGNRPRDAREGLGRDIGPGRMMARLPIVMALDADQDGEISAKEIESAVAALKKLDKNGDGKITMDELRPDFEGMGPGGPAGFGPGPGGFDGGAGNPQEIVTRLMDGDKDNDGYLSESELPERMRAIIARADTDGDKKLSRDELTVVAQRMAQAFRGQGPGREGPGREGERRRPPADGDANRPARPSEK